MKDPTTLFSDKGSTRGRQTLFRVTYRMQIGLIRIADNKANMIMGINAMIISILMGIISTRMILSKETVNENLILSIPIVLIMLTALFTTIFAIRAVQPRLISKKKDMAGQNEKTSLLFFENVWKLESEEYINKMENLLESPQEIYQNMIVDIHNQSKVLHWKYRFIRLAYIIFIIGYSISILSFLFLWLFIS